jgi:pimeloyl-ACP methyl ester carboxylesterase
MTYILVRLAFAFLSSKQWETAMSTTRRQFLGASLALGLAGCASYSAMSEHYPPIVFVHGNGDSASIWQTTLWRFESNGWPRERLHAIDLPYPLARDVDDKPQPGRTSAAEYAAYLKAEVEKVLQATGARQVVLVGNSRGGYAIRNYLRNGGAATVSHAVLGGVPNHGVWHSMAGLPDGSEFAGVGPVLTALNAPKNANGDEVTGPVQWLTIRSDGNDKYAQPDGLWLGKKGVATGITHAGPELKGATNVVLPRVDHRETAFSPAAFDAMYRFITGHAPATVQVVPESRVLLGGKVTGLGVSSTDPESGNFSNNLPLPGARLRIYAVDAATGVRQPATEVFAKTIGADGAWGPFQARPGTPYEFVIEAPGYATTHIYRSPFPRSSELVNLRPERIAAADRSAPALVIMNRPRGYLDPTRDQMSFDGQSPPPGVPPGAGVASSRIRPAGAPRTVVAEFNGERVVGRSWPLADNQVAVLELTY